MERLLEPTGKCGDDAVLLAAEVLNSVKPRHGEHLARIMDVMNRYGDTICGIRVEMAKPRQQQSQLRL